MRMRKKPNLTARMERCEHLLIKQPEMFRGNWATAFQYNELHIELGCGKGRFAVESAKMSQDVFFVAVEKLTNVAISALELADSEGLQNLRVINALADNLPDYFAPCEASRIYLNFCDPWPLNRHAKRRLTNRRFLELYEQVLEPEGEIHFKTDNLPFFKYSLDEFQSRGFVLLDINYDLHKTDVKCILTDYEIKFHSQGMPIYSAKCKLSGSSA